MGLSVFYLKKLMVSHCQQGDKQAIQVQNPIPEFTLLGHSWHIVRLGIKGSTFCGGDQYATDFLGMVSGVTPEGWKGWLQNQTKGETELKCSLDGELKYYSEAL